MFLAINAANKVNVDITPQKMRLTFAFEPPTTLLWVFIPHLAHPP